MPSNSNRPPVDPRIGLGKPGATDAGEAKSWQSEVAVVGTSHPIGGDAEEIGVYPLDSCNAQLLDLVAPLEWLNPAPSEGGELYYDLVAIGAGAGGLVSAKQSARRGARSALIEKHLAGGDCLNVGCVPSKALIRCARTCAEIREASGFGVDLMLDTVELDFSRVMQRMRALRAEIAPADSLAGTTGVGAACFTGKATFTSSSTVEVELNGGGRRNIRFGKAVVATGGSAAVPPIPGLEEAPYHINVSLFNMTALPESMVVIGAGPIGLEMAQAFALFGTKVTCVLRSSKLLPKEDPDAAAIIHEKLKADGIEFVMDVHYESVQVLKNQSGWTPQNPCHNAEFPEMVVNVKDKKTGKPRAIPCSAILVATGRKPNVEGLGLKAAGVDYDLRTGVEVNDFLQTTNPNIYAVGDVCSKYQFTHVSGTHAQMVVQNAFFGGKERISEMVIPWCTYTEPEVAHVGVYAHELEARGEECDTYTAHFGHNDRAILEGAKDGFVRVHCKKGSEKIIGATIVAPCAGEMISELTVAIQFNVPLGKSGLGSVIHSYPTVAEAVAGCAFQCKMKAWEKVVVSDATTKLKVAYPKDTLSVPPRTTTGSLGRFFGAGVCVGIGVGALFSFLALRSI